MSKICIDSSLALAWLLHDRNSSAANAMRQEWSNNGVELVTAPVFYTEIMSVLQQQLSAGKLLREEADEAFAICLDVPVRTVDSEDAYLAAWRFCADYDATTRSVAEYMAAAEVEDCEFWTTDWSLEDLAKGKNTRVKCIGEPPAKAANTTVTPKPEAVPKTSEPPKRPAVPNLDDPGLWRRF